MPDVCGASRGQKRALDLLQLNVGPLQEQALTLAPLSVILSYE